MLFLGFGWKNLSNRMSGPLLIGLAVAAYSIVRLGEGMGDPLRQIALNRVLPPPETRHDPVGQQHILNARFHYRTISCGRIGRTRHFGSRAMGYFSGNYRRHAARVFFNP